MILYQLLETIALSNIFLWIVEHVSPEMLVLSVVVLDESQIEEGVVVG